MKNILTYQELKQFSAKEFKKDNKKYYVVVDDSNQEFYYEEITDGKNKGKFQLLE